MAGNPPPACSLHPRPIKAVLGHLGSQAHGPASKEVSPSGRENQSAALGLPCQKHPIPEKRLLKREHLPAIPNCVPGTPMMERSTLRSIANALHPVSPPQPFTVSMGRENPFSFCRSVHPVTDFPPLCPHCPACLHRGRRARRAPAIHTGMARPHTGPRSCRAPLPCPLLRNESAKICPCSFPTHCSIYHLTQVKHLLALAINSISSCGLESCCLPRTALGS